MNQDGLWDFAEGVQPLAVGAIVTQRDAVQYDLVIPLWQVYEVRVFGGRSEYCCLAIPLGSYGEFRRGFRREELEDSGLVWPVASLQELDQWFEAVGRLGWRTDAQSLTRDGTIATFQPSPVGVIERSGPINGGGEIHYVRYPPLPQELPLVEVLEGLGLDWRANTMGRDGEASDQANPRANPRGGQGLDGGGGQGAGASALNGGHQKSLLAG